MPTGPAHMNRCLRQFKSMLAAAAAPEGETHADGHA